MASGVRAGEASAARVRRSISSRRAESTGADGSAFARAHGDQVGERPIEIGDDLSGECGAGRLVGLALDRLDHTANGQNAVERRRRRPSTARAHPLHGGDHLGQHVLIDAQALVAPRFVLERRAPAWTLPRASRAAIARGPPARAWSKPGGTRRRMSRPLPLTLRNSQVQR